jgi:hypothetical protein
MVKLSLAFVLLLSVQEPTNLTGDWTLSLIGDHVMHSGLVLEQTGTKLTGTMLLMGKEAPVDGEFVDGLITLAVKAEMRDSDGHGVRMELTGKLQDDGTLGGELQTPRGTVQWTAERLKKRK